MQAEVRDSGPLQRELVIRVAADEVGRFIDELVSAYRRRYQFRGFRPGKAPDGVVKSRFQDEIEAAVHSELVPRSIEQALSEHKIHPAAPGEVRDLRYRTGEALSFIFRVDVWPQLEIAPYEGLEVVQTIDEVGEPQVDRYLEMLREQIAEETPLDRPAQAGEIVAAEVETIDASGRRVKGTQREKVRLVVDSEGLLPEFAAAVRGVSAGETRELTVSYPDNYHAEELRGKVRHYRMHVLQIREKKLAPLDDQFAQKVAPGSDLEALRARVRLRLESEARMNARERLEAAIVERLIRDNPFDLPEAVVEAPLARIRQRMAEEGRQISEEELARVYRPQIRHLRRRDFVLGKVAEREGIVVGAEEVDGEIARMARQERRSVDEVRRELGDLDRFRDFLFERRVFDALLKKVQVREEYRPAPADQRSSPAAVAEAPTGAGGEDVVDAQFPDAGAERG